MQIKYNLKMPYLAFLLFFCLACSPTPKMKPDKMGFYYWQTTWKWNNALQNYAQKMQASQLYVRFFDVDWNEHEARAVPVSPLRGDSALALPAHFEIVPTIFITNRTISNLPDAEVEPLAARIWQKIQAQTKQIFPKHKPKAVQLDCDWSDKTRAKYFNLCKALKKRISPALLTVTIRLHQIKYASRTGVPPVDKGVLMCYNVGKIDGSNTENSILDIDILHSYAPSLASYSLPLDLALPTFAWGVLKRNGRVIRLLNGIDKSDFQSAHFEAVAGKKNTWRVRKAHYFQGIGLYEEDEIRLECVSQDLLTKAVQELTPHFQNKRYTLLFYHLHEHLQASFPSEKLQKLFK